MRSFAARLCLALASSLLVAAKEGAPVQKGPEKATIELFSDSQCPFGRIDGVPDLELLTQYVEEELAAAR